MDASRGFHQKSVMLSFACDGPREDTARGNPLHSVRIIYQTNLLFRYFWVNDKNHLCELFTIKLKLRIYLNMRNEICMMRVVLHPKLR